MNADKRKSDFIRVVPLKSAAEPSLVVAQSRSPQFRAGDSLPTLFRREAQ
jgi:hypothetical protein